MEGGGGGGDYAQDIPQQDFALRMQCGLMRKGGRICGTLRYIYEAHVSPTEAKCYSLSKSVMRSKYAIIGLFDFNLELSRSMIARGSWMITAHLQGQRLPYSLPCIRNMCCNLQSDWSLLLLAI